MNGDRSCVGTQWFDMRTEPARPHRTRPAAVVTPLHRPLRNVCGTALAVTVVALMLGGPPRTSASGSQATDAGRSAAPTLMNHIDGARIRTPELTYSGEGVDVDRDGDQDLFISNHTHGGSLWRNLGGGRFTADGEGCLAPPEPTQPAHRPAPLHLGGCRQQRSPRRVLHHRSYRREHVKRARGNELWIQQRHDGQLAERSARWRVGDVCGRGRVAEFVNANGDEFPDLVTSNARPRTHVDDECDTSPTLPNEKSKLFMNVRRQDVPLRAAEAPLGSGHGASCIVTLDYDSDGWQDLYLCRQSDERPLLFKNQQGHGYVDVTAQHQLAGRVSDAAVIDLDLDNDLGPGHCLGPGLPVSAQRGRGLLGTGRHRCCSYRWRRVGGGRG